MNIVIYYMDYAYDLKKVASCLKTFGDFYIPRKIYFGNLYD